MNNKGLFSYVIGSASVLTMTVAIMGVIVPVASAEVVCSAVPLGPVDGCKLANKAKFQIHDDLDPTKSRKDKVKLSWLRGDIVDPAEMGDPVQSGTEYALCLYDGFGGTHALIHDLQIPTGSQFWRVKSSNGFEYKDTERLSDGVRTLRLKADPANVGRSAVKLVARGSGINAPGPALPLVYFEQNPSVIINVVNSLGTCWTTEMTPADNQKMNEKFYKGRF